MYLYNVHACYFVHPHSSQQAAKKKSTPRKCRQNLNKVIHELASLVPLSSSQAGSLVPSNRGKPQTISVLRLTTTFLKLQGFMKDGEIKSFVHTVCFTKNVPLLQQQKHKG